MFRGAVFSGHCVYVTHRQTDDLPQHSRRAVKTDQV